MKITRVRVFELEGEPRSGLALYEIPRGGLAPNEVTPYRGTFTQVETDEGVVGLSHGGTVETKALGELLIGEDPFRVEYLWEKLYQSAYHRLRMANLAVLDLCLWDIIGQAKGEPVYRLLGGPTRERVRAYVGMLGFSTEPEAAAERSREVVAQGFTALKWYLPCNERDGKEGLRRNVALASTYGLPVVPHANESCRNAVHLLFASMERTCPLGEWGAKINANVQYFYQDWYAPKDGYFEPPAGPGFGYRLDEGKIRRRAEL